ncbi:MAG: hypothetical protein ACOC1K_03600, partial [Nanoarchaeota archaeon]
ANEGKRVLFIVASEKDKSHLLPKICKTHKIFIKTQDLKEDDISGNFFDVVIIDEYLYFSEKNQSRLYNLIYYAIKNIHISSTPRKLIDKNMFNLVKQIKNYICHFSNLDSLIYNNLSIDKKEEFDYLYYNFITDPSFQLNCSFDIQDYYLNKEQFEIEILGRLFK